LHTYLTFKWRNWLTLHYGIPFFPSECREINNKHGYFLSQVNKEQGAKCYFCNFPTIKKQIFIK